jgi:hypothetical protein
MTDSEQQTQSPIRILSKSTCKPIAPSAQGKLSYHIGCSDGDDSAQLYLRVTANSGGGFFSNEWIALDDILAVIEEQPARQPFKSLVFKRSGGYESGLYVSQGSNNCGFLSAVLRDVGILKAVPGKPYSHLLDDPDALTVAMQSAIAKGNSMKDEIAEHEKAMEKKRKKLAESMRNASKPKQKAKLKTAKKTPAKSKK